jgi:hypothetical protein
MELKIVNPDPAYATVKLVEPAPRGYIHVAVEVRPRRLPFLQRLPAGREKSALISRLTELARQLEALEAVEKVTVFDALAITPARSAYLKERGESIHVPRFDVVVLIETTSPAVIRDVQSTPLYEALLATLRSQAKRRHVMAARNNARWDESLPRFLWRQFSRKSFRTYVLANLEANRVGAMPVLYRLAGSSQQAARPLRPWVLAASVVAFGAGLTLARRRRAYAREFSVQRRP